MKNILKLIILAPFFLNIAYATLSPRPVAITSIQNNTTQDIMFAGDLLGTLYISKDHGINWQQILDLEQKSAYEHPWVGEIAIPVEGNQATVYAADGDGGVFRSIDNGESWSKISALTSVNVAAINDNVVYFSNDNHIFTSQDAGKHWEQLSNIHGKKIYVIDQNVFFVLSDTSISKTQDGGVTWDTLKTSDHDEKFNSFSTVNGQTLFLGTNKDKIYKSTDAGINWSLTSNLPVEYISDIIKVQSIDDNCVYVQTLFQLYRSTDGGNTWEKLNFDQLFSTDHPINYLMMFTFHAEDRNTITVSLQITGDGVPKIFGKSMLVLVRSNDAGETWKML